MDKLFLYLVDRNHKKNIIEKNKSYNQIKQKYPICMDLEKKIRKLGGVNIYFKKLLDPTLKFE